MERASKEKVGMGWQCVYLYARVCVWVPARLVETVVWVASGGLSKRDISADVDDDLKSLMLLGARNSLKVF